MWAIFKLFLISFYLLYYIVGKFFLKLMHDDV